MYTNNLKSKAAKKRAKASAHAGWRPDIEVVFLVGMIVAALLFVSPAMAQDGEAEIRMAHLSPDAPAVMVELDGEPVEDLANVSYKDSTPYLPIPAGPHEVAVFAVADPSEPVLEVSIAPEAGASYTVAGVGLLEDGTFGARLFEDDTSEPDEGEARVRVIHAIPDVGPATVGVADGPDLFALPGFANASDYAGVEAGTYTLDVTPAGAAEPAFDIPDVEVEEGEIYTAFAVGQASEGTIDAMLTVDSDNGRIVGPRTLEDTSGDLSLLEDGGPQPERASSSIAPNTSNDESSSPKDPEKKPEARSAKKPDDPAPEKNKKPEAEVPAESGNTASDSSGSDSSGSDSSGSDSSGSDSSGSESSGSESSGSESSGSSEVAEIASAPVETYQAPVESVPAPVEAYQAYQAPAPVATPAYTQAYTPPPAGTVESAVVVPTVEEVVVETIGDTGFVPPTVPVAPAFPLPAVEIPPIPTVEIPPIPVASGSWSSQTAVSTQTVTASGAATSGFVAPTPPVPPAQQAVAQQVASSQQAVPQQVGAGAGGAGIQAPVGDVVGIAINTPAVVNSGARRKFVTIRRPKPEGSA